MSECQMTLTNRQSIARDTMAFWFDANGARYEFRAGQHADFVFGSESDNSRTFSLASSPLDKESIMIAMRMRKTAFKSGLKTAALGTKLIVSRPRGSFTLHRDITRPAVFLAGGIGITPIRSILDSCLSEEPAVPAATKTSMMQLEPPRPETLRWSSPAIFSSIFATVLVGRRSI